MNLKRGLLSTAAALAVSAIFGIANVDAGVILPGHLVVTQVGDGAAALTSNATIVNVLDITTAGAIQQTIPLPIAAGGGNNPHTASGTQSEQHITLTGNGLYLTIGGYNATPGTATPANNAAIGRVISRIDLATGTVDSSTSLTDFGTGTNNNLRSVVSATACSSTPPPPTAAFDTSTASARHHDLHAAQQPQLAQRQHLLRPALRLQLQRHEHEQGRQHRRHRPADDDRPDHHAPAGLE
jgi:hypothetical protein